MTQNQDDLIDPFLSAHQNSDADINRDSIHHTLGPGPQQAAPGNHTHDSIIGSVIMYAGIATPANFILCDGSAVDRTTFAKLFGVIGTTYGAGDGVTTFNLPNFTNAFPRGNTNGASGGANTHQHSAVSGGTPTGTTDSQSAGTPSGNVTVNVDDGLHTHGMSSVATSPTSDGHNHGGSSGTQSLSQQSNTTATGASLRLTSPDPHGHTISAETTQHTHGFGGATRTGNAVQHSHTGSFAGSALPGHQHNLSAGALPTHQHDVQNNVPVYTGIKFLIRYDV